MFVKFLIVASVLSIFMVLLFSLYFFLFRAAVAPLVSAAAAAKVDLRPLCDVSTHPSNERVYVTLSTFLGFDLAPLLCMCCCYLLYSSDSDVYSVWARSKLHKNVTYLCIGCTTEFVGVCVRDICPTSVGWEKTLVEDFYGRVSVFTVGSIRLSIKKNLTVTVRFKIQDYLEM